MADDDVFLRVIGNVLVSNTVSAALFTTLYGAYLTVTFLSWVLLWSKRENKRLFEMKLLLFSICIFILTTALWVGQIYSRVNQIRSTLLGDPSLSLPERVGQTFTISGVTIANIWIASINSLYADAILIWRCWIISPTLRKWTFLAISLWFIYCMAALVANVTVIITSSTTGVFLYASTTGLVASFLVNVAATSTIATTVYRYRRRLKQTTRWKTPGAKVGLLFVESGFFYSFLQLTILIFHLLAGYSPAMANPSVITAAGATFQSLAYLAALYPTLVIIIVNVNRSFLDTTMPSELVDGGSGSQSDPVTGTIVFAPARRGSGSRGELDTQPVLLEPLNDNTDAASSQSKGSRFIYGVHAYPP